MAKIRRAVSRQRGKRGWTRKVIYWSATNPNVSPGDYPLAFTYGNSATWTLVKNVPVPAASQPGAVVNNVLGTAVVAGLGEWEVSNVECWPLLVAKVQYPADPTYFGHQSGAIMMAWIKTIWDATTSNFAYIQPDQIIDANRDSGVLKMGIFPYEYYHPVTGPDTWYGANRLPNTFHLGGTHRVGEGEEIYLLIANLGLQNVGQDTQGTIVYGNPMIRFKYRETT